MKQNLILYSYPMWHTVSFTLVARKHIEYIRKLELCKVYEIDELHIPGFVPASKYKLILHPSFYIMHRILNSRRDYLGRFREDYYKWWRGNYDELIGIDVCDSDKYSRLAVELANRLDKFIVPSRFCVEVAKKAGIKARIYRLPHGVDPEWYKIPNVWETTPVKRLNPVLIDLYLYKIRKNKKFILFWLWHSPDRKGWPEVYTLYKYIRKKRNDVVLILKTADPNSTEYQTVMDLGAINIYGWLDDYEKMALYDLADITLNFSRGGGFELNCLESLARGIPCVASDWGSWRDYVPDWLRVKTGLKVQPLPGNSLHSGHGYTVDVQDALEKIEEILDNLDEYKEKTDEYRKHILSKEYRWDIIAKKLVEIVED